MEQGTGSGGREHKDRFRIGYFVGMGKDTNRSAKTKRQFLIFRTDGAKWK